jgi:transposase
MIDLYKSGTTAKQVADKFGVSERSVTRLLRQHDVRRGGRRSTPRGAFSGYLREHGVRGEGRM